MLDQRLLESIENNFKEWGFTKLSPEMILKITAIVSGEKPNDPVNNESADEDINNLVLFYNEQNYNHFLQSKFPGLSPEEKVKWLNHLVEDPQLGFDKFDLPKVVTGNGGFLVSALTKTYSGSDSPVKQYIESTLGKIFQEEPGDLNASGSTEQYLSDLSQKENLPQPYLIKKEKLKGSSTTLTSFFFDLGGNIYAFSYQKKGRLMHTLIDTGERRHKLLILNLLKNNGIEPANIENILITHHHMDHSGLIDIVYLASNASVLVHPKFEENMIEGDLPRLGRYLKRLLPLHGNISRNIGDVEFPVLGEPLDIGEGARLEILGLPEGDEFTHSLDQLIFFYTPFNSKSTSLKPGKDWRPTDELLFSGDLWLMHPPGYHDMSLQKTKIAELVRRRRGVIDHRPQNRREKDALKRGFVLVTVKPGHGPEFLGTRILGAILSQRDILVKLGFEEKAAKKILEDPRFTISVQQIKQQSFLDFCNELEIWLAPAEIGGSGYQADEAVNFLVTIYHEQNGGGTLVGQDRMERRIDLRGKLSWLKDDPQSSRQLKEIAEQTLLEIDKKS